MDFEVFFLVDCQKHPTFGVQFHKVHWFARSACLKKDIIIKGNASH
jgi:hypothetical protein